MAYFLLYYKEAFNLGYISDSYKIKELINDVDCELKKVEKYALNKKAIDYNISSIIAEQDKKHTKYKKKIHDIYI